LGLNYDRRTELEGTDSHIVITDIKGTRNLRVRNIYRCFNPSNNLSQREFFIYQLGLISNAYSNNTILLGDFNLD
jgi:hypothetical protein